MIRWFCDRCREEIGPGEEWVSVSVHNRESLHPVYQLHVSCWPTLLALLEVTA